ncbi:hypothetical protein HQ447_04775 [bacterium]|nr:hypothetical protein [bacterium]
MKRPCCLNAVAVALFLIEWTHAADPKGKELAAAHRADPRSAAEIQQANLTIKSFPGVNPEFAKDRDDIPAWWQSSLAERDAFLGTQLKKGELVTYGKSAGGRPLIAIAYGTRRAGHVTTSANGALAFGDIRTWLGPDHAKRVALVFSAIHGGEFEGIVGTMNLLSVLEKPDLALNLHTGASGDNYFMGMLHTDIGPSVEAAWARLYRKTHTALAAAGLRSTTDPAIEADPSKVGPIGPNLDTAINLHTATLCALVESPSHSFIGKRRDGTPTPEDPRLLLDAHLVLFTATFDYLADTGGLAVWAGKKPK